MSDKRKAKVFFFYFLSPESPARHVLPLQGAYDPQQCSLQANGTAPMSTQVLVRQSKFTCLLTCSNYCFPLSLACSPFLSKKWNERTSRLVPSSSLLSARVTGGLFPSISCMGSIHVVGQWALWSERAELDQFFHSSALGEATPAPWFQMAPQCSLPPAHLTRPALRLSVTY